MMMQAIYVGASNDVNNDVSDYVGASDK